jgi:hypothetical protein
VERWGGSATRPSVVELKSACDVRSNLLKQAEVARISLDRFTRSLRANI